MFPFDMAEPDTLTHRSQFGLVHVETTLASSDLPPSAATR